jgi:hypothetical protein
VGRSFNLSVSYYTYATYFTTGFTNDTVPPSVLGTDPAHGDTVVPLNARLTARLSEPLDPVSVGTASVQLRRGAALLPGTLTLTDNNRLLHFSPDSPLIASAAHSLTLAGLRDGAGNPLVAPLTVSFTTGAGADLIAPSVTGVNPANGVSDVPRNSALTVVFSEPVSPLSLASAQFSLYDYAQGFSVTLNASLDATRTVATLTPASPLSPNAQHQLSFSGVSDSAGNALNYCCSYFKTGL